MEMVSKLQRARNRWGRIGEYGRNLQRDNDPEFHRTLTAAIPRELDRIGNESKKLPRNSAIFFTFESKLGCRQPLGE
jgi:hypothetical protein